MSSLEVPLGWADLFCPFHIMGCERQLSSNFSAQYSKNVILGRL